MAATPYMPHSSHFFACEQRNRGQGNRNLQRRGGLRPAVVLVHLRFALFIKGAGFGFQALCNFLDLVLLGFVAVNLGLVLGLFPARWASCRAPVRPATVWCFGPEVIPLVGGFRLLDGGIVLHQPALACVAPPM